MFFFRSYKYSLPATVVSAIGGFGSVASALGALLMFISVKDSALYSIPGILLSAAAVLLNIFVMKKLADFVSEKDVKRKLCGNTDFCVKFCTDNPGRYKEVCWLNIDFADRYALDSRGRIVKK